MVNYVEDISCKFFFSFISIYFILDSGITMMYVIVKDYPPIL